MRILGLLLLTLAGCCSRGSTSTTSTPTPCTSTSSGGVVGACRSAADCPTSLLANTQCSVLACDPSGRLTRAGAPLGCYLAPAPVGSPCTDVNDAGVVVCTGTCRADTSCALVSSTPQNVCGP